MSRTDDDQLDLLRQARDRAAKLVEGIRRQRDDVATNRPTPASPVTPEQLAQGRAALDNALASAERMLASVDAALEIAERDPGVMDPP